MAVQRNFPVEGIKAAARQIRVSHKMEYLIFWVINSLKKKNKKSEEKLLHKPRNPRDKLNFRICYLSEYGLIKEHESFFCPKFFLGYIRQRQNWTFLHTSAEANTLCLSQTQTVGVTESQL